MKNKVSLFLKGLITVIVLVCVAGVEIRAYGESVYVGQRYVNSAKGWVRYDDFNPNIEYSSEFYEFYSTVLYNGSRHEENCVGGRIRFSFYGTSIALIDFKYPNRARNCIINIDKGKVVENCSGYANYCSSPISVFYVKEGLENKVHNVVIDIPDKSGCFCLDAIDLNEGGYLLPYGQAADKEILDINTDKNRVSVNDEFTSEISISRIDNIISEDMTITYDSSKLKYLGAEAMDGVKILKNKKGEGSLRIVCKGNKSRADIKTSLIKLKFKAIAPGRDFIKVSKATVASDKRTIRKLLDEELRENIINIG